MDNAEMNAAIQDVCDKIRVLKAQNYRYKITAVCMTILACLAMVCLTVCAVLK